MFRWCSSSAFQAGRSVTRPVPTASLVVIEMLLQIVAMSRRTTDSCGRRSSARPFSHMRKPPMNA